MIADGCPFDCLQYFPHIHKKKGKEMKRVVFLLIILVRPDIPVLTSSCARTLEDYLSAKLRDKFFQGEFDVKHL